MADIAEQDTVDTLLECLPQAEPQLQYSMLKSLSKLRTAHPQLSFDRDLVTAELRNTAELHYHLLRVTELTAPSADTESGRLLGRAVAETQEQNRKRIFRLLGLLYSPRDMYNAYLGYESGRRAARGSALEFLDNVLSRQLQELLIPFLDAPSVDAALDHGETLFGPRLEGLGTARDFLLTCRDPWLRACATYCLAALGGGTDRLTQMRQDPDHVVRETAALVLKDRA
jgi:hypothetical protein